MRVVIVGLGIQGKKRLKIAAGDAVSTVDPVNSEARYKKIQDVPLGAYDAALVCAPDQAKPEILEYLLTNRKHALVEKPLLIEDASRIKVMLEGINLFMRKYTPAGA